jgi:hypothetical protein
VTRYQWQFRFWQLVIDDMQVRSANRARENLNEKLSPLERRQRHIFQK